MDSPSFGTVVVSKRSDDRPARGCAGLCPLAHFPSPSIAMNGTVVRNAKVKTTKVMNPKELHNFTQAAFRTVFHTSIK